MDQRVAMTEAQIETPSGKSAEDENFPVGSFLIERSLRPHVACFYRFARAADDIADNPELDGDEKIARLDQFEAGLIGGAGPECSSALKRSLEECGVSDSHARDLLRAFRQDAEKARYSSWDELEGYCTLSANPVGRFLMDLHGEDQACWPASDALCTVLQILNHLQDCGEDLSEMDRVYIPQEFLDQHGESVTSLGEPGLSDGMRRVVDAMLDRCDGLIAQVKAPGPRPQSRRLRAEMAVITDLAARLSRRLRREDPLAGRVALSKTDFARAGLIGIWALLAPRIT